MPGRVHLCSSLESACGADVLAGRKTVGAISGKVAFGGQGASRGFLRRYTGYVEQNGAPEPFCYQGISPTLACIWAVCASFAATLASSLRAHVRMSSCMTWGSQHQHHTCLQPRPQRSHLVMRQTALKLAQIRAWEHKVADATPLMPQTP